MCHSASDDSSGSDWSPTYFEAGNQPCTLQDHRMVSGQDMGRHGNTSKTDVVTLDIMKGCKMGEELELIAAMKKCRTLQS